MLEVDQCQIEYQVWGNGKPEIMMLHDGLGSMAQWGLLPAELAGLTGKAVLSYNRPGHGQSTPVPIGRWPHNWMQDQARLAALVLDGLGIESIYIVGHSDGASIALLLAAAEPDRALGVAAFSPHSYVETRCVDAIANLRKSPKQLIGALDRFHADARATFEAWSGGWVAEDFGSWDIRKDLGAIRCPALVAQGSNDEYATTDMLDQTVAGIKPRSTTASSTAMKGGEPLRSVPSAQPAVERHLLDGLGHMLFSEAPAIVASLVAEFVATAEASRQN